MHRTDIRELAKKYFHAWNSRDLQAMVALLHPQASYHDAFWGEACAGSDLRKFLEAEFETEGRWYRLDPNIIPTRSGMIAQYAAYDADDAAAHNNLGVALLGLGRAREAVPHFREALRLDPGLPQARENLQRALAGGRHPTP